MICIRNLLVLTMVLTQTLVAAYSANDITRIVLRDKGLYTVAYACDQTNIAGRLPVVFQIIRSSMHDPSDVHTQIIPRYNDTFNPKLDVQYPPVWSFFAKQMLLCEACMGNPSIHLESHRFDKGMLSFEKPKYTDGSNEPTLTLLDQPSLERDENALGPIIPSGLWPASTMSGRQKHRQFYLSTIKGEIAVWLCHRELFLTKWVYDREPTEKKKTALSYGMYGVPTDRFRFWHRKVAVKVELKGSFTVIQGKQPLVFSDMGELYEVSKEGAALVADLSDTESSGVSPQHSLSRDWTLVELSDEGKYVMFRWDGKTATPLDVKDKVGKNIDPFLPAKDVDAKITKAVTTMMIQRDKDEKEVASFRKKQETERKKKNRERPPIN